MLTLVVTLARAGTVTWSVAPHREIPAPITADALRVDGATAPCALVAAQLVCEADGAVTVSWAGGAGWSVTGDRTLTPGATGRLWVVADDAARADLERSLRDPLVTAEQVTQAFCRTGADLPLPPSAGMLDALVDLVDHEDPRVRAAVVESLFLLVTPASFGAFALDLGPPLPGDTILRLAADPSPLVRTRVAAMAREFGPGTMTPEVVAALAALSADPVAKTRRAAMASTGLAATLQTYDPRQAWDHAVAVLPDPGPAGRAAVGTITRLARALPPGSVDATEAIRAAVAFHPERAWAAWAAWRHVVPLDEGLLTHLLELSLGLSPTLVRHFAETDPDGLARVITAWSADDDDPRRAALAALLSDADAPSLRAALDGHHAE